MFFNCISDSSFSQFIRAFQIALVSDVATSKPSSMQTAKTSQLYITPADEGLGAAAPVKTTVGPENTKQTTATTTINIEDLFDNTTLVDANLIKQITARVNLELPFQRGRMFLY